MGMIIFRNILIMSLTHLSEKPQEVIQPRLVFHAEKILSLKVFFQDAIVDILHDINHQDANYSGVDGII